MTMGNISKAFLEIGDLLDQLEGFTLPDSEAPMTLTTVLPNNKEYFADERLSVTLGIHFPFLRNLAIDNPEILSPSSVEIKEDGSLYVEFEATVDHQAESTAEFTPPHERGTHELQREQRTTSRSKTDDVPLTTSTEVKNTTHKNSQPRDPYRDPEKLEAVYETYDTFTEMTEALNVDVTPQTVRRYMIKYGIHEPASQSGTTPAQRLLDIDPDTIPALKGKNITNGDESSKADPSKSVQQTTTLPSDRVSPSAEARDDIESEHEGSNHNDGATKKDELHTTSTRDPDSQKADRSEILTDGIGEDRNRPYEGANEPPMLPSGDDTENVSNNDSGGQTDQSQAELHISEGVDLEPFELPSHLTFDEVKMAVKQARTLHEAQQLLKLDRDGTRRLLKELNLLDLVYGRLSTQGFQEHTIEDINLRIQNAHPPWDERTISRDTI